ncbi:MAG: rod shape-determining protein [Deltaproteobacteria bacterium]|nr:rod shape-determining protein [Deltaproteobacteria bacterium]
MFRLSARDLAIDLGSSSTLIYEQGRGIVVNEPSIVAMRQDGARKLPLAFGAEAKAMLGRTPEGVQVIRPIRNGVIVDFEIAGLMVHHFLMRALKSSTALFKPRVVVGLPCGITEVEKRAIRDAVSATAIREIRLVDEAMAAVIGADLPVLEPTASMVVDLGGGTTDVAVVSLSDIVSSLSIRQGGDAMDEAIINYMRRCHHLLIGENTAEQIKNAVGAAHPEYDKLRCEVRGRSLTSGSPAALIVSGAEVREAIGEVVAAVIGSIRQGLENTPPELAGDILSCGVTLVGGVALLKGLDCCIQEKLGIEAKIASDPISAVVEGAGRCLNDPELSKALLY